MINEQETFIELGNLLLRLYCNNTVQDIKGLTKLAFRDGLIPAIASEWNLSWSSLPDEETFYRAFRKGECSTAMREKMALLYYAKMDESVGNKMNKIYEDIAGRQRIQWLHFWHRFVEQMTSNNRFDERTGLSPDKSGVLELELEKTRQEMAQLRGLLKGALEMAKKKDEMIEREFTALRQQRIADNERVRQLQEEVKSVVNMKSGENSELKLVKKYFVTGNYSAYQNVLDNNIKNDVTLVAQTYYLKGKGFEATLQYKNALKAYEKAQQLEPDNPEYLNALGHFLYLMADFKAANDILNQALALVEKGEANGNLHANILNNIGELYREKDDFDKAIGYFKRSLAINEKLFGTTSNAVAVNLNNLGLCWMDKAAFDKAIGLYQKVLLIRKKVFGRSHPQIASVLNDWGLALKNKGEFKEAVKKYKEAIKIVEVEYGDKSLQIASYLNNIGEIWREQSKYDDAIKNYTRAIAIYKSLFPHGHPKIAGFLNNLGAAWKEKGDYRRGIELYQESLALNHKLFGEYNISIGHNFNNLGLLYHALKRNDKAIESYTNALRVYKKLYKGAHPDIAKVYSNMGGVFHDRKQYKKAIHSYTLAKNMYEKYFNPTHVSIAFPLANLARVYDELGDYDVAIKKYNIALKYFSRTYGAKNINVAHIYNNLGQTWHSKGNKSNSIKNYMKALSLFEQIVGPKNHFTVKCRSELKTVRGEL